MKRFLAMLLITGILFGSLLTGSVSAQGKKIASRGIRDSDECNSGPAYETLDYYTDITSLRTCLDTNLKAMKTEFDISRYNIPLSQIDTLCYYIFKDIPEAFHVEEIAYTYYENGYYVIDLLIVYNMDKSTYNSLLSQCQAMATKMTADLAGLSDVEKALLLHDRVALQCEYDVSLTKPNIFDMVGVLVNGVAVCEGYAKAYSYLLDKVGIKNYYCVSQLLNHGWNIVYIGGVKYHVDVTWDDPTNDVMGQVLHTNFLRSSYGMIQTGHYKGEYYDFDDSPSDTRYDNAYWQNSDAAFQLVNGNLYYIDWLSYAEEEKTYLVEIKNGSHQIIADVSATFTTNASSYFGYQKLANDGQDLLFSTGDAVYRYCLKSKTIEKVWSPPLSSGFAIFGFDYKDGYLNCVSFVQPEFLANTNRTYLIKKAYTPHQHTVHTHSYDNDCDPTCNTCGAERSTSHIFTNACDGSCNVCGATRTPPHAYDNASDRICNLCGTARPEFAKGDVDGSGSLDVDDVIQLLFYLTFPESYPVNQTVDFDGSGTVDIDDVVHLLFHLTFADSYPLH